MMTDEELHFARYISRKQHTDLRMEIVKTFRVDLAEQLTANYCSRKKLGQPPTITPTK